jgi:hypothetical protein
MSYPHSFRVPLFLTQVKVSTAEPRTNVVLYCAMMELPNVVALTRMLIWLATPASPSFVCIPLQELKQIAVLALAAQPLVGFAVNLLVLTGIKLSVELADSGVRQYPSLMQGGATLPSQKKGTHNCKCK